MHIGDESGMWLLIFVEINDLLTKKEGTVEFFHWNLSIDGIGGVSSGSEGRRATWDAARGDQICMVAS